MLKKTITYTDYNNEERTEDFYFNLSRAELLEMELGVNGKMSSLLEQIVKERDVAKITEHFKTIIHKAYGQKSLDGKHFMKSPEILNEFIHTEAYSNLFVELATNDQKAIEFINGLVPQDLRQK